MATPSFDPSQLPNPAASQWLNPPWMWPPLGSVHTCVWTVVSSQDSPRESGVTVALLRCGLCGDVCAEELVGTWTLEQVRGEEIPGTA